MPYTPRTWVDGVTKLGPTNLNPIENGIFSSYAVYDVMDPAYGAKGDGVTDDTAAIQAAINACPAGGVVRFRQGTYKITGLTISKGITLQGTGGADAAWTNFGTLITMDSATGVAFTVSAHRCKFRDMAIQNVHATAPTAGAGIKVVSGGGDRTHYGPDLCVRGFFYNIDHQAGKEWTMDPSCFLYDFASIGLRIQNVDSVDGGDMMVSGNFYAGPVNNGDTAIEWLSGGGFKGYNLKVNTRGTATLNRGIALELQDGINTSDFQLCNSSIENCTWGVILEHIGVAHTGTFQNLTITGCEFETLGNSNLTATIAIAPSATGKVSLVNVCGNTIAGTGGNSQVGINFTNLDRASHGPNVFLNSAGFGDGGGNTNVTAVRQASTSALSAGPPSAPRDGDIWLATGVGNGSWQFRYNAGSASAFKWEFVGGAPLTAYRSTNTAQSAGSTFQELDTALRITLARAGDYLLTYSAQGTSSSGNVLLQVTGWDATAAAQVGSGNADSTGGAGNFATISPVNQLVTGWTAGHVVSIAFWTNDGTPANTQWGNKSLGVIPVRVS